MTKKKSNKPDWEAALEKFLSQWQNRPDVIAALLTGSYAQGTENEYSDIDVHLILAPEVKWRERGNVKIDGFVIEYFANTENQLDHYAKSDRKKRTKTDLRMFAFGKIIFDRSGILARRQKRAKQQIARPLPRPGKVEIEMWKYSLWDELENLAFLWESKSEFYPISHFALLTRTLNYYRQYLRIEIPPITKLDRYFRDRTFRTRYGVESISDKTFERLFLLANKNICISTVRAIVEHAIEKMGGFDIDGWRLRSA